MAATTKPGVPPTWQPHVLVDRVNAISVPGQPFPEVARGLREHFRPEESPADVDSLEELNPSLVTLVPDFGFAPSKAKLPKKVPLPEGKQQREDPTSKAEKRPCARRPRIPEGAVETAKQRRGVPGGEGAALGPSRSARLAPGAGLSGRKDKPRASKSSKALAASARNACLAMEAESASSTRDVPATPFAGAPAADSASNSSTGACSREVSTEHELAQAAPARGRAEAATVAASTGASRRTVHRTLEESRLEPRPVLGASGVAGEEESCAEAGPLGHTGTMTGHSGHSQPNRANFPTPGDGAGNDNSTGGLQLVTVRTPLTTKCNTQTSVPGPPAPAPASGNDAVSRAAGSKGPHPQGVVLKCPILRALAKEDRTSSFGSGTFVVEDFLSSLEPETPRGAGQGQPLVYHGSSASLPRHECPRPQGPGECDADSESAGEEAPDEIPTSCDPDPEDWKSSLTELFLRKSGAVPHPPADGDPGGARRGKSALSAGAPQSRFSRVAAT